MTVQVSLCHRNWRIPAFLQSQQTPCWMGQLYEQLQNIVSWADLIDVIVRHPYNFRETRFFGLHRLWQDLASFRSFFHLPAAWQSLVPVYRPRAENDPFQSPVRGGMRPIPDVGNRFGEQLKITSLIIVGAILHCFLSRLSCSVSVWARCNRFKYWIWILGDTVGTIGRHIIQQNTLYVLCRTPV